MGRECPKSMTGLTPVASVPNSPKADVQFHAGAVTPQSAMDLTNAPDVAATLMRNPGESSKEIGGQ
jgi:hypothetical protein